MVSKRAVFNKMSPRALFLRIANSGMKLTKNEMCSRIIQQAINDVAPGNVPEDGQMGPATYNAFRDLARDNKTCRPLLDALIKKRKLRSDPGEADRLEYFRFVGKC